MAILTLSIELLNLSNILTLIIQVLVGISVYVLGSAICRLEPYRYLKNYLRELIKSKLKKDA